MDDILKKWSAILEAETAPKFKTDKIKRATAIMLENQAGYMEQNGMPGLNEAIADPATAQYSGALTPNGNAYSGDGFFHKMAIPMVRRTFPELIAHEIVGVQPLTGPVGLAFAMRFVADGTYDSVAATQEVGFNTIDSDYSGSYVTSAGEALGSNSSGDVGLGFGDGTAIPELSMTLEKAQIEAKTRKLRSRWSVEVAQDLQNMHGLNLEDEMTDALSYEITAETDRELIARIRATAATTTLDYDSDFDGRWESEKYKNLYNAVVRKSNEIAITTRRGPGNWVVANTTVCAALETLPSFAIHPVMGDVNTAIYGVAKVGSLDGRMMLYRDTFYSSDDALIGYKGINEYDTGVVYLPYVQLMQSKQVDYGSFQPGMGLLSRYAIHDHIFGASNYYRNLSFTNMP